MKRPIKNWILCQYSCEVKIFENKPETWQGAGVNQVAGRMRAAGRQLGIADLDSRLKDGAGRALLPRKII